MEELFFFMYHLGRSKTDCWSLPVHERKWIISRFNEQKRKENDAIEKMRRNKRR